jgi:nitroimidazol reductase NimA-like FMN-containing flavoprotein (pyridoxamine 5'-phosphate oxidase superfamily)
MLIRELTAEECTELLRRHNLARLACAREGQPYVVPIHYSFDAERRCAYAFSTLGQKVSWMRENPLVCLEVDEIVDKDHWSSVVVYGVYEEIQDADGEEDARRRAEGLFQHRRQWWLPATAKLPGREPHAAVVYRIAITRVTGRRADRN